MAESSASTQQALLNFLGEVCSVLPNVTSDLLEKLIDYLDSAGVCSEADIEKVQEDELSLLFGHEDAEKLLEYFKNRGTMVGNDASAKEAVTNVVVQVRGVLPGITPDAMEKLLEFLLLANLHSEADIENLDERELGAVIGDVDAKRLLCYLKNQQPDEVEPYSTIGSSVAGMPGSGAVVPTGGDSGAAAIPILQMIMEMQRLEAEKNRQMITEVTATQREVLKTVTDHMSQVTTMHKATLDKMSEQMTEQSKMHQKTVEAMSEQMETSARMQGETLKAVHASMDETRRMNMDTMNQVAKHIGSSLEAQQKSMQELQKIVASRREVVCAIM